MATSPDASFTRASFPNEEQILYHQAELEVVQMAELKAQKLQEFLNASFQEIERLKRQNAELEAGLLKVEELKENYIKQEQELEKWKKQLREKDDHISDLRIEVSTLHEKLVWERGKKKELMRRAESADRLIKEQQQLSIAEAETRIKKIEDRSIKERAELEVAICKLKEQLSGEEESTQKRVAQLQEDQSQQIEEFKNNVEKIMKEKNEELNQKQQEIKSLLVELDSEKQKLKQAQQRGDIKEKAGENQIKNLEQLLNAKNEAIGGLQRDVADLRAENAQMRSQKDVQIKTKLLEFESREKQLEQALEEELRRSELKIVEKTHHLQMESNELKSKLKMMRVELQLAKAQSERLAQFERITLEQASEDKQQNQQIVENVVKSYETQLTQRVEAYQKIQGDYQRVKLNLQIKEEEIKTLKIKLEQREQELLVREVPRLQDNNLERELKNDEIEGLKTANQLLRKDVDRLEDRVRGKELEVDKLTGQLNATRHQLQRATGRSHPEFRQTGSSFGIKEEFDSSLHKMGREFHKNFNELLEGSGEDFFRNSAEPTLHGSPMPQRFKSMDLEAQNKELKAALQFMQEQVQILSSEIKEYKNKLEGYQGLRTGFSDAEFKNLRLQLDEKQHELFQIQNALIQERERVLRLESNLNELILKQYGVNLRNQQLNEELLKVKGQRQKLAEVCSDLKAELSVLRKKDQSSAEEYYQERIERLQETIEDLEAKLRRYELRRERYPQQDKGELVIEGDQMTMVERGPNTPQRLHYKANSTKATASQLLSAERMKAKTKAAQAKVTQPKKKPDSAHWLGHK